MKVIDEEYSKFQIFTIAGKNHLFACGALSWYLHLLLLLISP